VVLAARTREALAQAMDQIKYAGGDAVFVEADVANRADLDRIAETALERFGRIDTWVNNAGVGIWGMIDEVSEADMRQLFEINFWGTVHGSQTALKHLRANGGRDRQCRQPDLRSRNPAAGHLFGEQACGERLHGRASLGVGA
jgi:NAD(P)-dependent dehydrogenase (short-subunit alcohol dehydrogenase family)